MNLFTSHSLFSGSPGIHANARGQKTSRAKGPQFGAASYTSQRTRAGSRYEASSAPKRSWLGRIFHGLGKILVAVLTIMTGGLYQPSDPNYFQSPYDRSRTTGDRFQDPFADYHDPWHDEDLFGSRGGSAYTGRTGYARRSGEWAAGYDGDAGGPRSARSGRGHSYDDPPRSGSGSRFGSPGGSQAGQSGRQGHPNEDPFAGSIFEGLFTGPGYHPPPGASSVFDDPFWDDLLRSMGRKGAGGSGRSGRSYGSYARTPVLESKEMKARKALNELGLPEDKSQPIPKPERNAEFWATIKRRYRKLSREHHPDAVERRLAEEQPDISAAERTRQMDTGKARFQKISEAYEMLGKIYDPAQH